MKLVLVGAVAGAASGVGVALLKKPLRGGRKDKSVVLAGAAPGNELTMDTILIKNPAFSKSRTAQGTVISTKTGTGKIIAYRLEAESEFVWDKITDVPAYYAGKTTSVGQLLKNVVERYRDRSAGAVERECMDFLKDSLRANVVFVSGLHIQMPGPDARRDRT